jgi:hypothetical protein
MGWKTEAMILSNVQQVQLSANTDAVDILTALQTLQLEQQALAIAIANLSRSQKLCCEQLNGKLNKLIVELIPPIAVTLLAEVALVQNSQIKQGAIKMAKKTAGIAGDLQVADNGTFTVACTFIDADGVNTGVPAGLALTYTASDGTPGPSALTLTPSTDTSSCAGSINQATIAADVAAGTALPTGLTVTVAGTWTGLASPASVTAAPAIDVVAGPAGSFVAADTTP